MGDIDFEEQLELERLERERKEKLTAEGRPLEKVDPDGTVYEWDAEKQAWFPKIDSDFIAQYQMNYGESSDSGNKDETGKEQQNYEKYYNYYQNYYQAQVQHEELMSKKKGSEKPTDESHEETVQKLEHLENKMQEQGDSGDQVTENEYQTDSKEVMEQYTDEQKKHYNEYWSYYYGTDYHDYYSDCLAHYANEEGGASKAVGDDTKVENEGGKEEEDKNGKKKGKKRKGQQQQRDEGWFKVEEQHNTHVFVSGLPLDITESEFKELMSKYGLIMYDPRTRQPKLKLYMDENGQPKGDGRCCFIKKESVDLILNLLDGADYRGHTLKVERAQFNLKGEYDPSKKKKKLSNKEKRKLKERQAKLFDWRPDKPRGARLKHEKIVILKNVFDPKMFEDDPGQINTLTKEIRTECSKFGEVKKVAVFDRHPDGVVKVFFTEPEEADMCVEYLNHRYFAQRRLIVATWDGKTKYEVEETEAQREERLKKWEKFLETGEKSTDKVDSTVAASTNTDKGNNSSNVQSATIEDTAEVTIKETSSKKSGDTDDNRKEDSADNINSSTVDKTENEIDTALKVEEMETSEGHSEKSSSEEVDIT